MTRKRVEMKMTRVREKRVRGTRKKKKRERKKGVMVRFITDVIDSHYRQ